MVLRSADRKRRSFTTRPRNLLSETDPLNRTITYSYDSLHRQITETGPDPDGGGSQLPSLTTTVYDDAGNVSQTIIRLTSTDNQVLTYAYDDLDREISVTDARGGVTSREYDSNGNLLKLTDPEGNETTWVYDGLDRVTTETDPLSNSRSFEYDLEDNQTAMTDRNGRPDGIYVRQPEPTDHGRMAG